VNVDGPISRLSEQSDLRKHSAYNGYRVQPPVCRIFTANCDFKGFFIMLRTVLSFGLLGMALIAPASALSSDFQALEGRWDLVKSGGKAMAASDRQLPYFVVHQGKISGFDGCNKFGGDIRQPERIAKGQRGCKGSYVKLPLDLGDPAGHLKAGKLTGDRLQLPARRGQPASEFRRR
jgi:hypothetical protein